MEKKYVVYTITLQGKVMYVGKTKDFNNRKWKHLNQRHLRGQSAIPEEIDLGKVSFNVAYITDNKEGALKEEDRLILLYNTIEEGWNGCRSGECRKDIEYVKLLQKKNQKVWYEKNREEVVKKVVEYHRKNREHTNEYMREFRKIHREEINAKRRENYLKKKQAL